MLLASCHSPAAVLHYPSAPRRAHVAALLVGLLGALPCQAHEDDAPPATATSAPTAAELDPKHDSRRHFENGINLFEDRNYTAALAEFEAAYRQYPSASALQNIALCQKELYRYSEARDTLSRLLSDHEQELQPNDRLAIEEGLRELANLIGSVRISVVPPNAIVSLDGHIVPAQALRGDIVLDVGEHIVSAQAEGFAPISRRLRVAGGHTGVPVSLQLTETTGTVIITAPDAHTAIAIDGRPVAFARWKGRLEPGPHFVQVYREGYEPFEEEIDVEVGKVLSIRGVLGGRTDPAEQARLTPRADGTSRRAQSGYYGLIGASLLVPRGHPSGFRADSDYELGWSLGLRVGYRVVTQLGFEAQVDSGSFSVQGHCTHVSATACPSATQGSYSLDTRRFGAAARLFSSSETLRLTSSFAAGLVSHDFGYDSRSAAGVNPYVAIEAGLQANWRHGLWELVATAIFDGASNIGLGSFRPYAEGNGIQFFGVTMRIGWGEWMPSRAPLPPMPQRP